MNSEELAELVGKRRAEKKVERSNAEKVLRLFANQLTAIASNVALSRSLLGINRPSQAPYR